MVIEDGGKAVTLPVGIRGYRLVAQRPGSQWSYSVEQTAPGANANALWDWLQIESDSGRVTVLVASTGSRFGTVAYIR